MGVSVKRSSNICSLRLEKQKKIVRKVIYKIYLNNIDSEVYFR